MPLVRGDPDDEPERPAGRIRNTRKMLTVAALIMSFYLVTTSLVTAVLIPAREFETGGDANGRALAYVAHDYLGDVFGTAYDLCTIAILWFAGASALAGLLNIVPRYLPRYGMAPEWARAIRPLVLVYIAISAYRHHHLRGRRGRTGRGLRYRRSGDDDLGRLRGDALRLAPGFQARDAWVRAVTVVFVYALVANEIQRPDGLMISSFFIVAIVLTSLVSRIYRSLELRQRG